MLKFTVVVISFGVLILAVANVFAQTANEEMFLEKIVVTPYKTAVSSSLNPSATDVLWVDELNARGIFSLTDAIKDIPSLSYATSGGLGGDTGLFIRGAESRHTQVLLDGIKLYDPAVTSAYFYGYNYITLDNIEKIEVSKGPYSALYGSDSIGGTVNLITHKGKGKPTFSYLQEFGSYQTTREMLSSQGEFDKLAYSLSISRTDVASFYSAKCKNGNQEKDPYHNLNSSLRLDYALNEDIDLGIIADYTYAKYEYDGSAPITYVPADDSDNYAYFYQGIGGINLSHNVTDSFSYKTLLGYTRTYRKSWEDKDTHGWYNGTTYQMKWQGDYQLFDFDKVIFGFDYLSELGESRWDSVWDLSISPKETSNTKGYYIENVFLPVDDLFFAVCYRLEDHSMYKNHNTFSISGAYLIKETNTKIKSSFGEGFKAPSLYQLHDSLYGDPNLNPEESESYDIGFEQKLGDSLTIGSTYFHTQMKDLIEWVSTGVGTGKYTNVGKSRIYGIENFVEYLINDAVTLTVSYTHMDTEKSSDGTRLLRRPNNKLTCKLKFALGKSDIYTGLSYIGNRIDSNNIKLKSYILSNIVVNFAANKNLDIFVRFENILDKDYELISGYQTPKFCAYLGAKLTF